jgi:hypothetical protein
MGQVFGAGGLSDSDLFDHKVILDLSRVVSSETKSMIMAMAVMRLQEYHMANNTPDNTFANIPQPAPAQIQNMNRTAKKVSSSIRLGNLIKQ